MEVRKAVFLDKDGTIIPNIPFNVKPDLITLNEGVLEGLSVLNQLGYLFIVITNQSGVAKGLFQEKDLIGVKNRIQQLFMKKDLLLSGFYYCPHSEEGIIPEYTTKCSCRKPGSQLILTAAKEHQIDLSKSWVIGDILDDVEAGKTAGCKSLLINNGNEKEWLINGNLNRIPDWISSNFLDASMHISCSYKIKDNEQSILQYNQKT